MRNTGICNKGKRVQTRGEKGKKGQTGGPKEELANEQSKPRIVSGPKEANTTQLQNNTAVKVEVLSFNINFTSI